MHWTVFFFGALALLAAHLLRLPKRGGAVGGAVAFLVGLFAMAFIIRSIADYTGIGRTTDFDGFVNRGIEIAKQDDAPLIIFTGASFSRNAIDDERLTLALRERGYPHRVISLSLEAASILERDAHLKDFMARSPRPPEVVFVEVAESFDKRATFFFGNSKFSTRGIEQFTPRASLWSAYGIMGGACYGTVECVKDAGFLGAHTGLNVLNVGLLSKAERTVDVAPAVSYSALNEPREAMNADDLRTALATDPETTPIDGPAWVRSYRAQQADRLRREGVHTIAYYFPPVTPASERAYASGLCVGELAAYTCIAPDDPQLLASLPPEVWADPHHLQDKGTATYLVWLADQIAASKMLDAKLALRGAFGTGASR